MKVKPRKYFFMTISNFSGEAKCYIDAYPQQTWNCEIIKDRAHLSYKNISLEIPKTDFEKYWKVVE